MARSIVLLMADTTAGTSLLAYVPTFDSLSPYSRAGIKPDHLGGDLHQNLDATFVVNFLKLFQASAHEVFGVRSTVVTLHALFDKSSGGNGKS